jgi:hypothetical protein
MSQTTYYAKAVCAVHGAVISVNGRSHYVLTWSMDKQKDVVWLATAVDQMMREKAELFTGVSFLHIWSDNAPCDVHLSPCM